ncbi:uncharacterized protein LOC142419932, partial [Mycteria americana]|uniref:uncharacterized protein LOC142419932 n=1 Tax=Mycteria americana TaxID=33587 RepID=UPI003F5803F4
GAGGRCSGRGGRRGRLPVRRRGAGPGRRGRGSTVPGRYRTGVPRCGGAASLTPRPSRCLGIPRSPPAQPARPFLIPVGTGPSGHWERRVLGYSAGQMYKLAANVGEYRLFVPWCSRSAVLSRRGQVLRAELEVGFPPFLERYVSEVFLGSRRIRAVSRDCRLFRHLETLWRFGPGLPGRTDTCLLDFSVSLLRVQVGAARPAGQPVSGRGGEADGVSLRGPGAGAVRAAGSRPSLSAPAGRVPGLRVPRPRQATLLGAGSRVRPGSAVGPAQGLALFTPV